MIAQQLIRWYSQNKRSLPWRETKDPYKIWLSEIILQQTRVDQGTPYYLKFIENFPTVVDLANASEQDVLLLWQGLGYYSRARNIHFTAKFICNELDSVFPIDYNSLLKLKGIGPYTAAAIASIAYNEAQAVVDGNVYRVLARLHNINEATNSSTGIKLFQKIANELLDPKDPGNYNQAIMELGALVCKPTSPLCNECPIAEFCIAKKEKTQESLPVKLKKVQVKKRFFQYLVFTYENRVLLNQREAGDIWQGMYDFPLIETNEMNGEEKVMSFLSEQNIAVHLISQSQVQKHILTHQIIQATFWKIELSQIFTPNNASYFSKAELEFLPKPKLIVNYIQKNLK